MAIKFDSQAGQPGAILRGPLALTRNCEMGAVLQIGQTRLFIATSALVGLIITIVKLKFVKTRFLIALPPLQSQLQAGILTTEIMK